MSTRSELKTRKNYFKLFLKRNPDNLSAKKVIDEINFIQEALKSYVYEDKK
jgi:hypothetical protein